MAAAVISGCAGFDRGVGETVAPDRRKSLDPGGPHTGAWVSRDLIFSYRYLRDGDRMTLDGTLEFRGGVSNFMYMRSFYLQAYYLDPAGQVIAIRRIYNSPRGRELERWRFTRELTLPPAAVGWAIGYSGIAIDGGPPRDEIGWSFWDTPFK
jgi:hypothetical protein